MHSIDFGIGGGMAADSEIMVHDTDFKIERRFQSIKQTGLTHPGRTGENGYLIAENVEQSFDSVRGLGGNHHHAVSQAFINAT